MTMKHTAFFLFIFFPLAVFFPFVVFCQSSGGSRFSVVVVNEHRQVIPGATVKLLRAGKVMGSAAAGEADGVAVFTSFEKGVYRLLVSSAGYQSLMTDEYHLPGVVSD